MKRVCITLGILFLSLFALTHSVTAVYISDAMQCLYSIKLDKMVYTATDDIFLKYTFDNYSFDSVTLVDKREKFYPHISRFRITGPFPLDYELAYSPEFLHTNTPVIDCDSGALFSFHKELPARCKTTLFYLNVRKFENMPRILPTGRYYVWGGTRHTSFIVI